MDRSRTALLKHSALVPTALIVFTAFVGSIVLIVSSVSSNAFAQPTVQSIRPRPGFPRSPLLDTAYSFNAHAARSRVRIYIDKDVSQRIREGRGFYSKTDHKVASTLLEIIDQLKKDGSITRNNALRHTGDPTLGPEVQTMSVDSFERISVYLDLTNMGDSAVIGSLVSELGGYIHGAAYRYGIIEACLPAIAIRKLAGSNVIRAIRKVDQAYSNAGAVLSEGVARSRSDVAQRLFGTGGGGVTVGVISDDCGSNEGLFDLDKLRGELNHDATNLYDGFGGFRTHEGLALSEIVQDVAPDARILFESGQPSRFDYSYSLSDLAASGAKIIVDDQIFAEEPVFEDGDLSMQEDDLAAQNDILFVSSANNQAGTSFMGRYANMVPTSGKFRDSNVCDFGGGNYHFPISIWSRTDLYGAGQLTLHWDDPYAGSGNDFNLYVVNSATDSILSASTNIQSGTQIPFENASLWNSSNADVNVSVIVVRRKVSTRDPNPTPRIKLTGYTSLGFFLGDPTSSLYGHAAAKSCIATGAVSAAGFDHNTIEAFSDQGPAVMVSYPSRTATTRIKPDVTSFDRVSTSVPYFSPFTGTSAAAPHVAGLAALLRSKFPTLTAAQCRDVIRGGGIDEGDAGPDNVFGFGGLDGFKMFTRLLSDTVHNLAAYSSPAAPIPDGTSSLGSTIRVTPYCSQTTLDSVYLSFTIEGHRKYGDLVATLTSPDGHSRIVLNRPANGLGLSFGASPNVVLGDNATIPIESFDPGATEVVGFYLPANSISGSAGFKGMPIDGNWTLNIADKAAGNSGVLREWGLYFKLTPQRVGYLALRTSGDLPDVNVGSQVCQQDTLYNTGTGPLTITTALMSGDAASEYQLSGLTLPLTLAPNTHQAFSICCTPTKRGTRSATLNFDGNSLCSSLANGVSLSVNAKAACASLTNIGGDTSTICVGSNTSFSFTLSNCGDLNSNYVALLNGSGASAYSLVGGNNPPSLTPGSTETITVMFTPTTAGAHAATLTITPNNAPAITIGLLGIGVGPSITAAGDTAMPTQVGEVSAPLSISLSNQGECDWSPGVPQLSDSEFVYVAGANLTIAPHSAGTMQFIFTPHSIGEKSTTVTFPNQTGVSAPAASATLKGLALKSTATLNPGSASDFTLLQNFPNPFNPGTEIGFTLPRPSEVNLDIFDVGGKLVTTLIHGKLGSGAHAVHFDGSNLASGTYEYRLTAAGIAISRHMTMTK